MLSTEYLSNEAKLNQFDALTDDWRMLFAQLVKASRDVTFTGEDGQEHDLTALLENNVLSVLADIRRKKLEGYAPSFSDAHGTVRQQQYVRKLEQEIEGWAGRLDAFIQRGCQAGPDVRGSVSVARELRDLLRACLAETQAADAKHRYYRMLRAVSGIRERFGKYLTALEACSDVDPSISLLYAYLRNYSGIANAFNRSFAALPDLYRRKVLGESPRPETADSVYLLVSPREGEADFTLPQHTAFAAGDLLYETQQAETVCRVRCTQSKSFSEATAAREFSPVGWQVESSTLVLEEGYREIVLALSLKGGDAASFSEEGLTVQYSTAAGWQEIDADCSLQDGRLQLGLVLDRDAAAPAPCAAETHAVTTEFPALRLLIAPFSPMYAWAETVTFSSVTLRVSVAGIRDFVFYNDLGDVDTTQPFAAFGLQAEKGAWFVFGKDELGVKKLKSASLRGTWQKMPDSKTSFDQRYADYGIDASSFNVSIEYQENNLLKDVGSQPLFAFDADGALAPADIKVVFDGQHTFGGSTSFNKDGYFRVTLQAPEIGFGLEKYRSLFLQVMLENSKSRKSVKSAPEEPCVPYLVNVELSYEAEAFTSFATSSADPVPGQEAPGRISLSRILEFADRETFPWEAGERQPLAPPYPAAGMEYFAFADALGENGLRVYLDMVLPKARIPYGVARPGQAVTLDWELWNGVRWQALPPEMVVLEETCGLTQSGYVELAFGEIVASGWLDRDGQLWIRAAKHGDTEACLELRNVWTNCVKAVAGSGFQAPLPAGSIQALATADDRVAQVSQPYPSFGGRAHETDGQMAARLTAEFRHRLRAVTQADYESLLLELFPEVEMVQCFPLPRKAVGDLPRACLVVYSSAEDRRYYLSSAWKLSEIAQTMQQYAPAGVQVQVTNPQYERLQVRCVATLHSNVPDKGKVLANLTGIIATYFMPWETYGGFPQSGKSFSFLELYARIVNHEDVQRIVSVEINGQEMLLPDAGAGEDTVIRGAQPWSVLLAESEIILLDPDDGIGGNGIEEDFIIG